MQEPRVAIVCDWLTDWGGAERVILAIHKLYPKAPIFTSIYNEANFPELKGVDVRTSFIQHFPGARHHHQWYLTFMPEAFESFDLSDYDIVISSAHSCAKGVITKPETLHVSYCHTPPRYLWDDWHNYVANYPWPKFLKHTFISSALHRLRLWDRAASERVDHYIANSKYVANRIKKYYRRDSIVIYPPVEMTSFKSTKRADYFLAVGRLIPYKRFDLIVEAFNDLKLPLKIVGIGNQFNCLKKAAYENIEFLGKIPEGELQNLYSHAKALIFPQVEDFGIIPVEAMSHGCPIIAYAAGGALETVKNKVSGIFFEEQSTQSLKNALEKFNYLQFEPGKISKHAEQFGAEIFTKKLASFIEKEWAKISK
ncbi:TPA: glycosyltransferase family 4 protein [Candidatus Peregrinibacteria bacterium]|nr:glycosyltransferase family 4 protein [Candidatus Peregrinibacteria bacterium]